MRLDTSRTGVPRANKSDACVWRTSWNRIDGTPAAFTRRANLLATWSACRAWP